MTFLVVGLVSCVVDMLLRGDPGLGQRCLGMLVQRGLRCMVSELVGKVGCTDW